jgi:hypothetical protein
MSARTTSRVRAFPHRMRDDPRMRTRRVVILVVAGVTAVGCSKSGSTPKASGPDPCSAAAMKLGSATKLTPHQLPDACTANVPEGDARIVTSIEAAGETFACPGAVVLDFATTGLAVTRRTLSPATVGVDAYDDGKTVTWVTRFRSPCPNDPHPMPVPATLLYLLPNPGERAFAEANCTVETKCP